MVKRNRRGRILPLSVLGVLMFAGASALAQSSGKSPPTLQQRLMAALQDAATAKAALKEQAKKQEEFISALAAAVDKMKAQRDALARTLKNRDTRIDELTETKKKLERQLKVIKDQGLASTQVLKARLEAAKSERKAAQARIAELKARLLAQAASITAEVEKKMAPRISRHAKAEARWEVKLGKARSDIEARDLKIKQQSEKLAELAKNMAELRAIKVKQVAATPPKAGGASSSVRGHLWGIDRLLASTSALLVGRGSRQVCVPYGADGSKVCDRVYFNWAKIAARRLGRARHLLRKTASELR